MLLKWLLLLTILVLVIQYSAELKKNVKTKKGSVSKAGGQFSGGLENNSTTKGKSSRQRFEESTKVIKALEEGAIAFNEYLKSGKILKKLAGTLGAAGMIFSIVSIFVPLEDTKFKFMVQKFEEVNNKLDVMLTKMGHLENLIKFENQKAAYIQDETDITYSREILKEFLEKVLALENKNCGSCLKEKAELATDFAENKLKDINVQRSSSRIIDSILSKGLFADNMLIMISKVYDCNVTRNREFVIKVIGLTFKAQEVILALDILQGNGNDMLSIIDKWVKDMLQIKDKLYEVNDICYRKIQNERKIRNDIDKEIRSIKTRGLQPFPASREIKQFLSKKYFWITWVVFPVRVFDDFLCDDGVFHVGHLDDKKKIFIVRMDKTGQVPGSIFSGITRKLNTAKFDKKHAFWSKIYVELEECTENLKTLDPIRKELTEWDRKYVKSIVVVGDCFNCKNNYTFDKSTDEKIIQIRRQFVHRDVFGRVLKHFARIILVFLKTHWEITNYNPCESNSCSNGGKCYTQPYSNNFLCHCQGNYEGRYCESSINVRLVKTMDDILKVGLKIPKISDIYFGLINLQQNITAEIDEYDKSLGTRLEKLERGITTEFEKQTEFIGNSFVVLREHLLVNFDNVQTAIDGVGKSLLKAYNGYNNKLEALEDYIGNRFDWLNLRVLYGEGIFKLQAFIKEFEKLTYLDGDKRAIEEKKLSKEILDGCDGIPLWLTQLHHVIAGQSGGLSVFNTKPLLALFMKTHKEKACTSSYKVLVDSQWSQLNMLQINGYKVWAQALISLDRDTKEVTTIMNERITGQLEKMKSITCNLEVENSVNIHCTGKGFGYASLELDVNTKCIENYYVNAVPSCYQEARCEPCNCKAESSKSMQCTPKCNDAKCTAQCECKEGYYGDKCENRDCVWGEWGSWSYHTVCPNYPYQAYSQHTREKSLIVSKVGEGTCRKPPIQYKTTNNCCAGYIKCITKGTCISNRYECDYRNHCGDNSDESQSKCTEPAYLRNSGWVSTSLGNYENDEFKAYGVEAYSKLKIDCQGKYLKSFELEDAKYRQVTQYPKGDFYPTDQISYSYYCATPHRKCAVSRKVSLKTRNYAWYLENLDQLRVEADNDKFLTGFQLKYDNLDMWYEYTQCKPDFDNTFQLKCREFNTPLKNSNVDSKKMPNFVLSLEKGTKCSGAREFMQSFVLEYNSSFKNQFRYKVKCCTIEPK